VRKIISTTAVVTALVIAATFAPGTVDAGCPGSQLLDATFQYLVSNPNWGGNSGGDGRCGQNGCYDTVSGPPVSSTMRGVFWALGSGDPAIGVGNDSGIFSGGFTASDFWLKQISATFAAGLYHYPAWISLKINENFVVGAPVTWSAPDADGCGPGGTPPAISCTCFMLSDEYQGAGYFMTMSAQSDVLGNTQFNPGTAFHLAEIPKPVITASSRDVATADVTLTVTQPAPVGGTYPADGCGNCLGGFRVYGQIVPRGAPAPTARSTGWTVLPNGAGGAQGTTAFGGSVAVRANCDPAIAQDLYLAIAIVGEGTTPFITSHVSRNSTMVQCGANLADPQGNRPSDPRPDRGRDGTRHR
jgi:hypothetical protein